VPFQKIEGQVAANDDPGVLQHPESGKIDLMALIL
jgi:hypothetical protein